jgi:hypothetical protein
MSRNSKYKPDSVENAVWPRLSSASGASPDRKTGLLGFAGELYVNGGPAPAGFWVIWFERKLWSVGRS